MIPYTPLFLREINHALSHFSMSDVGAKEEGWGGKGEILLF